MESVHRARRTVNGRAAARRSAGAGGTGPRGGRVPRTGRGRRRARRRPRRWRRPPRRADRPSAPAAARTGGALRTTIAPGRRRSSRSSTLRPTRSPPQRVARPACRQRSARAASASSGASGSSPQSAATASSSAGAAPLPTQRAGRAAEGRRRGLDHGVRLDGGAGRRPPALRAWRISSARPAAGAVDQRLDRRRAPRGGPAALGRLPGQEVERAGQRPAQPAEAARGRRSTPARRSARSRNAERARRVRRRDASPPSGQLRRDAAVRVLRLGQELEQLAGGIAIAGDELRRRRPAQACAPKHHASSLAPRGQPRAPRAPRPGTPTSASSPRWRDQAKPRASIASGASNAVP